MQENKSKGSVELTADDTARLQEYLRALEEIAQREPERLPAETWDAVMPQIQATGEVPAEYRDRIGVNEITVYSEYVDGKHHYMPEGKATKGYYDIVWERWNSEATELRSRYQDVILKALRYVWENRKETDESKPVSELLKGIIGEVMETMTTKQLGEAITGSLLSRPYVPMLTDALVNDFMQINTRGLTADRITKRATFITRDGHKFTIEHFDKLLRSLSTPAKKIFNTAIMFLTASNYYNAGRVTPTVEIPIIEYGEKCGYKLTPRKMATPEEQAAENKAVDKRIIEFKKDVRSNLHDIKDVTWTAEKTKGRNKGDYEEMSIISSHRIIDGILRINFDVEAAEYLVHSYVMQHPTALLAVDNRNPNAYALGYKIAQHYSMDSNAARGTNSTLSVESLLAAAPEIQTIDDLKARGQRNWKDKIKKPLENSLNELVRVNMLSRWEYRDPATGRTYTPETAQPLTWAQYSGLMVDFIMINAPDQTARRETRIAAAAAQQAAASKEQPRKKRGRPRKSE